MPLKPRKSLLIIGRLRAPLIALFGNFLMLRRITVSKATILHFLTYIIPIVSLDFYIHLLQNHWQNIQILRLFHKIYVCICRVILDFSFLHNFVEM